jgi:hypothetical protein
MILNKALVFLIARVRRNMENNVLTHAKDKFLPQKPRHWIYVIVLALRLEMELPSLTLGLQRFHGLLSLELTNFQRLWQRDCCLTNYSSSLHSGIIRRKAVSGIQGVSHKRKLSGYPGRYAWLPLLVCISVDRFIKLLIPKCMNYFDRKTQSVDFR